MSIGSFPPIHGMGKSPQKSHSTRRSKWATFTIWVGKNALKWPKIAHFGDFPTICVFVFNSVCCHFFFLFSWHGCLFSPRRMRRMSGWKDAAKHLSPFISLHRFSSASQRNAQQQQLLWCRRPQRLRMTTLDDRTKMKDLCSTATHLSIDLNV